MTVRIEPGFTRAPLALQRTSASVGHSWSYLLGIIGILSGCAGSVPPPESLSVSEAEWGQLRADNASLEQRVQDLEAERDRLRAKLASLEPASEAGEAVVQPNEPEPAPVSAESEALTLQDVSALPVVKLTPGALPQKGLLAAVEEELEAARPVLRAYGEEEGTVTQGRLADETKPGKK